MSIIYWDFDGTITYSNSLWSGSVYDSLNQVLPDNNVSFTDIRKCMAVGFTWHTPDNDYTNIKGELWWEYMLNKIMQDYISLGVNETSAIIASRLVRNKIKEVKRYTLYDDAISTLSTLKKLGHKNILLSNNYPDLIEVIEKLNLSQYFDDYVISAVEGYDKPRIELFDIAKIINHNNQKMYMIGDSENADIIGGNNGGMTTIFVHNGYSSIADYSISDLSKIIDIVK